MKVEITCVDWLKEAIEALTEQDFKTFEPTQEFNPSKGESLLGEVSDETKCISCLRVKWHRELEKRLTEHLLDHLLRSHPKEDCERVTEELEVLAVKLSAVNSLLRCSVRYTMNISALSFAIRKGWKLVALPEEKVASRSGAAPRSMSTKELLDSINGQSGSFPGGSSQFSGGFGTFLGGPGSFPEDQG